MFGPVEGTVEKQETDPLDLVPSSPTCVYSLLLPSSMNCLISGTDTGRLRERELDGDGVLLCVCGCVCVWCLVFKSSVMLKVFLRGYL